jgi:signal transduction histidine kinase
LNLETYPADMPKTAAITKSCLVFSLLSLFLLPSCSNSYQHSNYQADSVDVSGIRFARNLYKYVQINLSKKNTIRNDELADLKITDSIPRIWRGRFPPSVIEKEIILRFVVRNNSDSLKQLYFFPGTFFNDIRLFKVFKDSRQLAEIKIDSTPVKWRLGFRQFDVNPRDTSVYIARLSVIRSTATGLNPVLLQKDFIEPFVSARIQAKKVTNIITYLIAGVMLMMILYSLAAFRLNRNKEFFYYSGYAFCIGLLLFLKSFLIYDFTSFNFYFESYWDLLIQCLGVGFYFQFVRHYLDTKQNHPFLEKTFRVSEILITCLLAVYTVVYFFTNDFIWLDLFENITKQILLVIGIVFIIYGIKKNDKLMRWLVWGNIFLVLFSIVSFLLIVTPFTITNSTEFPFLNDALIYYELGLALELIAFLMGLAYKNRRDLVDRTRESERLKIENERKEMEKQMAVLAAQQDERNRISADMHDELGSGVTAIRLMSEIVKSKMKEATLPEIEKISNSANDLITKMNTIIWTMASSNDTVESLVTYMRTYAFEFFENTNIECKFNMPESLPKIELSGERRRNIFLAVKEAMNNVLKHSKASLVQIDIEVTNKLRITIMDNGLGIDFDKIRRFGNGLRNMQNRLENINGQFTIKNQHGTIAIFELVL